MKRTIEVSTRGTRLFLDSHRLVVEREGATLGRIPLEDLGLLILDSDGIRVSSGLMAGIVQAGGALLLCDSKHLPKGLLLPTVSNSLHAERIRHQADSRLPLRKNLWSAVVKEKIRNQSALVEGEAARTRMASLEKEVKSGDSSNREALAAQTYWPSVFQGVLPSDSSPFRRRTDEDGLNSLLNYGYAVLRAATARALVGAGLHTGLGIHHRNRYSGHPLADDMMEPYRPFVDYIVKQLAGNGTQRIDRAAKEALLGCLTLPVRYGAGTGPLAASLERLSASLAIAFESAAKGEGAQKASRHLVLPSLDLGLVNAS